MAQLAPIPLGQRVRTVAAVATALVAVVGCADVTSSVQTTPIGTLSPGPAVADSNFFGVSFTPCTALELEGYPTSLARASVDYYQGPWCARTGDTRTYLWAYARAMTAEQSAQSIEQAVLADAEQLVLDLEAQGYRRVCGAVEPGQRVDAGFETAAVPSRIRISNGGGVADPIQATSTEPPALVVALSPATRSPTVEAEAYAPPC